MSDNFRQDKLTNFTVIRNEIIEDKELSLKALGLAVFMLHLPPDWSFSIAGLSKVTGGGETVIKSALNELEEKGYLKREQANEYGKFGHMVYVITDKLENRDFPLAENPPTENPLAENLGQINTKEINTNISSSFHSEDIKQNTKDVDGEMPENLKEVIDDFRRMRKSIKKPMSDRALKMLMNRLDKLAGDNVELKIKILEQSIYHNWQDVYPLKENFNDIQTNGRTDDGKRRGVPGTVEGSGNGSLDGTVRFPRVAYGFQEEEGS